MASSNQPKPGRALAVFGLIVVAMAAAMVGTSTYVPKLGLDLSGGTTVILRPVTQQGQQPPEENIEQAVQIIRQRVNALGVSESEVTKQGQNIVVAVPGAGQREVVQQVGQTAKLRFRQVLLAQPANQPAPPGALEQIPGIDESVVKKFRNYRCQPGASRGRLLPEDQQVVACNKQGTVKYVLAEAKVLGTMVTGAQARPPNPQQGISEWYVTLDFNGMGTKKWADFTGRLAGQPPPRNQIAIVLDGTVVSAPRTNEAILGGQTQIEGGFTQESASDLATILKYGSLPLKFEKSEIQQISATLGADQLRAGLLAGGLGLILLVVYSLLHYRALGIVSVVGLATAMALSYAAVVLLGIGIDYRLSIAGVTGLIVAIGITVDSFIVYFERLRDEIREGHSPRLAVERSWIRARRTILSADVVSLLAAVVLWVLAVGGVKGFAFTLGLTTLVDTLVVFLFTKPILTVLVRYRFFGRGHPLSGIDPRRLGARRQAPVGRAASRGASAAREA